MSRPASCVRRGILPVLVALACLRLLGDGGVEAAPERMAFRAAMPRVVVWAWEEPEDLSDADPRSVGVAYLAETILVGTPSPGELARHAAWSAGDPVAMVRPRRQPLTLAPGLAAMPVVRIETRPGFRDTPELRRATAELLAQVADRPGASALQIDFDATRSQRAFYAGVLRELRGELPAGVPLSITALVSWCDGSAADWLEALPVDEVVPMLFRLGGHAKAYGPKDGASIREPLCRRALGLSTDESWPAVAANEAGAERRIYLFSPAPWSAPELVAAAGLDPAARPAVLRVRDDAAHAAHGINDTGLARSPEVYGSSAPFTSAQSSSREQLR